jgi:lycopene beta-cyclase
MQPGQLGAAVHADFDLVVLGGGCAGLSLALRLAEQPGACKRVLVLESRAAYTNDRSWCFWRLGPHRHEALVRRSWYRVAVRSPSSVVPLACANTPYQMIEARTFYDHALANLAGSTTVGLQLGTAVLGPPRPVAGGWRVETAAGGLTATQVIDTRPPRAPQAGGAALWQSFLGQEVVCDRPVFDAGRVELMDFALDSPHAVAFTYVLPLAADRGLIETTLFDAQPRGPAELALRQQQAVQRLCGSAQTRVVRTEAGILPMGLAGAATTLGPGHVCAGLMSGAARPATGYAFQRIQRWADSCAVALGRGQPVCPHPPDPLLTRFMDRLFLDVLRNHPERGPELFMRLFARAGTPRVLRFLSDQTTFVDRVAVAASLPTGLFLRQLLLPAPVYAAQAKWL